MTPSTDLGTAAARFAATTAATLAATMLLVLPGCTALDASDDPLTGSDQQAVHDMNGCSLPLGTGWLDIHGYAHMCSPDNNEPGCGIFIPACNDHDNCYQHEWQFTSKPAGARAQCDADMHTDHMAACRAQFDTTGATPDPAALSDCFFAAQEVVLVVDVGGAPHFHVDPYTSLTDGELSCAPKALDSVSYSHVSDWQTNDPYCAPNPCVDPGWSYKGQAFPTESDALAAMRAGEPDGSKLTLDTTSGPAGDDTGMVTTYRYTYRQDPDPIPLAPSYPPDQTWYHRDLYFNDEEPLIRTFYNPYSSAEYFWGWRGNSEDYTCTVAAESMNTWAQDMGDVETCFSTNHQVTSNNEARWTEYTSTSETTYVSAALSGKICSFDYVCTDNSDGSPRGSGHRVVPLYDYRFEEANCPPEWRMWRDVTNISRTRKGFTTRTITDSGAVSCKHNTSASATITQRTCPKVPRRCGLKPGSGTASYWDGWYEAGESLPRSKMCWYNGQEVEVR